VIKSLSLLIGQLHHLPGTIGKSFVHASFPCKLFKPTAPPVTFSACRFLSPLPIQPVARLDGPLY
jgi:hypothetical protein